MSYSGTETMTNPKDAMREKFEAQYPRNDLARDSRGRYVDYDIQQAFDGYEDGWNAHQAHILERLRSEDSKWAVGKAIAEPLSQTVSELEREGGLRLDLIESAAIAALIAMLTGEG
jgi:hypothetical protein